MEPLARLPLEKFGRDDVPCDEVEQPASSATETARLADTFDRCMRAFSPVVKKADGTIAAAACNGAFSFQWVGEASSILYGDVSLQCLSTDVGS